jgi:hypothetical protein
MAGYIIDKSDVAQVAAAAAVKATIFVVEDEVLIRYIVVGTMVEELVGLAPLTEKLPAVSAILPLNPPRPFS